MWMPAGDSDMRRAVAELEEWIPAALRPLARIAFNYRWSWAADGAATFEAIDADRWMRCGGNPRRLLTETGRSMLNRAAGDAGLVARIGRLAAECEADMARPWRAGSATPDHPAAFFCAEYGVHGSLPIYSGGLGILAGDILKQASDLALPMVGVGLMYRTGYFHQRIDVTGYQHEYWLDADPERLACVLVTGADGHPMTVSVPVDDGDLTARIWRVDVGRVPLYLLDTDVPENSEVERYVSSRLYESNRSIRLAQYALLGVGGVRALQALGIDPSVYHLNEGHPALAALELQARAAGDLGYDAAIRKVREKLVFTTHTPIAAGNETYSRDEVLDMLGRIADQSGGRERFLSLGRFDPANQSQPWGLTAVALRTSRHANGVSKRHGEVARAMWQPLFADCPVSRVPIGHVTNGVHIPTWLVGPMRELLTRYLGPDWLDRADQEQTWAPVADIPAKELWAARRAARAQLVDLVTRRGTADRLRRGEPLEYAEAVVGGFDPDRLTIGFARRLATYKRLHLIGLAPERAVGLISGARPVQFVFAGKAHPSDGEAKEEVRRLFALKNAPAVAGRAAFLEDYDIPMAGHLVAGCDVWVNLPRPPLEASGTSGMKSCLGGGLQLSVLDGWWAEAYDGNNGWAIPADPNIDWRAQDERDAGALFDLLERQVVPMFHERDAEGIPQRWVSMMRRSLMTNGPRFSAARMVLEYIDTVYPRD